MTGPASLERWYRRLPACYSRRFRDDLGEALFYAGPLLTAGPAMISAIRPRHHQVI